MAKLVAYLENSEFLFVPDGTEETQPEVEAVKYSVETGGYEKDRLQKFLKRNPYLKAAAGHETELISQYYGLNLENIDLMFE